jgi:carbamoyl-phosphate synthase large subunit
MEKVGLKQPENGVARSAEEAFKVARRIGYPVMVRPSYVLGGRAMETVYDEGSLARYMREAVNASPEHPVLVDRFLRDAIEVDLDLVADTAGQVLIGGVLEHIQEAGVHSGDAACTLPPHSLSPDLIERMKDQAVVLARELKVVGLMNVQFAIQGKAIYVLEVNPRGSRTVPFVSKATGVPLAKIAALCMVGKTLAEQGHTEMAEYAHKAVKEAVFPFARFSGVDVILGPEMKSTGEVMGLADDFPAAFAKAQLASGVKLPKSGQVFMSVKDDDKPALVDLGRRLTALGFTLVATGGTHKYLRNKGVQTELVLKVTEGRPNIVDQIVDGGINLVINTTFGRQEISDSFSIRREALMRGLPYYTTVQAARMAVEALEALARGPLGVRPLQDYLKPQSGLT